MRRALSIVSRLALLSAALGCERRAALLVPEERTGAALPSPVRAPAPALLAVDGEAPMPQLARPAQTEPDECVEGTHRPGGHMGSSCVREHPGAPTRWRMVGGPLAPPELG